MRRFALLAAILLVIAATLFIGRSTRHDPSSAAAPVTTAESDGGQEEEGFEAGGNPDAAPENHVGTTRVRNRVLAPTTLAAVGWAGEVQVANEDTWEPDVAGAAAIGGS